MNVDHIDNHQRFSVTSLKILAAVLPNRSIKKFDIHFNYCLTEEGIS